MPTAVFVRHTHPVSQGNHSYSVAIVKYDTAEELQRLIKFFGYSYEGLDCQNLGGIAINGMGEIASTLLPHSPLTPKHSLRNNFRCSLIQTTRKATNIAQETIDGWDTTPLKNCSANNTCKQSHMKTKTKILLIGVAAIVSRVWMEDVDKATVNMLMTNVL